MGLGRRKIALIFWCWWRETGEQKRRLSASIEVQPPAPLANGWSTTKSSWLGSGADGPLANRCSTMGHSTSVQHGLPMSVPYKASTALQRR